MAQVDASSLSGDLRGLPKVHVPQGLSDIEVEKSFGSYLSSVVQAFQADPSYVVAIVESAKRLESRQRTRQQRQTPVG